MRPDDDYVIHRETLLVCSDLTMKLLLLLLLSSAGLHDVVDTSSQHQNVLLNPDQEETAPERSSVTHRRILSPATLKLKRDAELAYKYSKLKWQTWSGSLPNGSVSVYNHQAGRVDYVCKHICYSGFYSPDMGFYCYYLYEDKQYQNSSFDILVNEDNFEILEWMNGSRGSVPPNSVRTCIREELYVGKSRSSRGKVHPQDRGFFLPWKGSEYQVLTINLDVQSEHISNVKYNTSGTTIFPFPLQSICVASLTNSECSPVLKTAELSKTGKVERRWDFSGPIIAGINRTFAGHVPRIVPGSIVVGAEVTLLFTGGQAEDSTENITHSMSVELTVPPNYSCRAVMVGRQLEVNAPFTADLRRTYRNRGTTWTSISGMYESRQVGEVQSEVGQCKPVIDAASCSTVTEH
ncbi:hypothetical protein Q5P01_015355 [Channa striata]|uniref:Natterin-3-like n=1 Tax=Channa striata TaxID=64152 RepID=A0AA88MJX4_CHASR|nr:hypothetical protein Q5P01_015355 [Channa striata]